MSFVGLQQSISHTFLSLALPIPKASQGVQDDKEIRITVLHPELLATWTELWECFSPAHHSVSFTSFCLRVKEEALVLNDYITFLSHQYQLHIPF